MINSKTLGRAVGTSQNDVYGNAGPNVPSINQQGVVVGRFKRGRTDKPFKVTAKNYKALLGEDQANPSYLIIQDAFIAGASEIWVLRIGNPVIQLSDGTHVSDDKKYEQIAFESNLYPAPVAKEDIYKSEIEMLDAQLRSQIVKPAKVVNAYWSEIKHFDIKKASDGKSFELKGGYKSAFEILDSHLGSVLKQPVPINSGYKASVEALSLSLRYGFKLFVQSEAYKVSVEQLNIERISKIKEKDIDSGYAPTAEILDAKLSQVLQVAEAEEGTSVYTQSYTLLDLTMSSGLIETAVKTDAYQAQPEMLDLALHQALSVVDITTNDGYLPIVRPLDARLINTGQYIEQNDGYFAELEHLDISYVNYLGSSCELEGGYTIDIKVLSAEKANFKQVDIEVSTGGYASTIEPLNIFTTQRIR